jgi:hypothetical protein
MPYLSIAINFYYKPLIYERRVAQTTGSVKFNLKDKKVSYKPLFLIPLVGIL